MAKKKRTNKVFWTLVHKTERVVLEIEAAERREERRFRRWEKEMGFEPARPI